MSLCVCQLLVLLYCLNRFSSSSLSEDAPLQEDSLPAFCGFAWFPPQAELQRRKGEMCPVAHNQLTTKGTHCRLQIICIAATSHTSETRAMRHNKRVKQSDESKNYVDKDINGGIGSTLPKRREHALVWLAPLVDTFTEKLFPVASLWATSVANTTLSSSTKRLPTWSVRFSVRFEKLPLKINKTYLYG